MSGWSAPQFSLMLRPSGAMLRRVTLVAAVEAAEELGGDGGGGSVGAVDDDVEAGEGEAGDGVDEELDVVVLIGGVVFDGRQGGGIGRGDLGGVMEDFVFDGELDGVGELEAVGAEELDAVVLPGIVRGGDDDAGVEAVLCGRGRRRRGWGRRRRISTLCACLAEAGGEGGGDPGAGLAGVAAEEDFGVVGDFAEGVGEGEADGEDGGGVEGGLAGDGADAVGAEEFAGGCGHGA